MNTAVFAALLVVVSLVVIGFLVYSKVKAKDSTREQYAFKCLVAVTTLVTLAIASISSKQSIGDQVIAVLAAIMGHPLPEASPAPFSEKALIVVLVTIALHLINKSHQNWTGLISSDEIDRRRMKRTTSLISQAIDESVRLVANKPKRKIYKEEQRVDPVAMPEEPNLVWYDHARELFELWMPSSSFQGADKPGWDPHAKCWVGEDRYKKLTIFLFCITEKPNSEEVKAFEEHVATFQCKQPKAIYAVYRDVNGIPHSSAELYEERTVTVVSEEYLYSNIIDFSDYFTEIERRVESDFFPGSNIAVKQIYTASSLSLDVSGNKVVSTNLGHYLSDWSKQPAGRQIAILGEYGQGKSTGALMYVYDAIKSQLATSGERIPILLELRGKSPANLSPHELLAAWAQRYKFHASSLMKLLIAGRLILIFEGFDEMANVASLESRVSHFRSLWRFAYPKSKIIFTGRRNLFFEDRELHIVFKGATEGNGAPLCEVLHLCPFDFEKIRESLRWVDDITRQEIIKAAKSSHQIFDIVARPALLYIVASLWDQLRPLLAQGRITSAQIIDRFILYSYERQQMKERDLNFMALTTTERRYFHEGLAVYMASHDATNQITNADLRAAIERLYRAYPDDINVSDTVVLETERPPLKVRIPDHAEAIEAILTDVRTHGILVNDLGQRDAFRFAHKSFYELLAAKVHAFGLLGIEPVFYQSIRAAMDGSVDYSDRAPEILNFFSEMLLTSLRTSTGNEDVAVPAFDLLVGVSTANVALRHLVRATQLLAMRLLHNRKFKICFFATGLAMSVLGVMLSTQWFPLTVMKLPPDVAHQYRLFLDPKEALQNAITVAIAVVYFIFITYTSVMSSILTRKSKLWAAVLLTSDYSRHATDGKEALIRLLGKATAKDLTIEISKKYGFNSPATAIKSESLSHTVLTAN